MLAALIVASTHDRSGTSSMWMVPENSRKCPRTFEIIMWRATNWTAECEGSIAHRPGGGTSLPWTVLAVAVLVAMSSSLPAMASPSRRARNRRGPHDRGVPLGSAPREGRPVREPVPDVRDLSGANPRLAEAQIAALATRGRRRATWAGEVLFREGDLRCDFFVVLDGTVEVVEGYGDDQQVLAVHGPGCFLGDVSLLVGQAVFVDGSRTRGR